MTEAKNLKGFRIAAPNFALDNLTKYNFAWQAIDVLVSTDDGATWTVAASYINLVDGNHWADVTDTIRNYLAFEGMLSVTGNVTHVAIAIPDASVAYSACRDLATNGLVKQGSGMYNHVLEVEFYY